MLPMASAVRRDLPLRRTHGNAAVATRPTKEILWCQIRKKQASPNNFKPPATASYRRRALDKSRNDASSLHPQDFGWRGDGERFSALLVSNSEKVATVPSGQLRHAHLEALSGGLWAYRYSRNSSTVCFCLLQLSDLLPFSMRANLHDAWDLADGKTTREGTSVVAGKVVRFCSRCPLLDVVRRSCQRTLSGSFRANYNDSE